MLTNGLGLGALASALLVLSGGAGSCAALKVAAPACSDEATLKKGYQIPADADGQKAAAYFKGRIDEGECQQFARGQQVTVDERHEPLWCVRPSGGLDCFWTLAKAIDLNPPIVSNGSGRAGGGRKGRH
ncbi:MAG TPA: hypothetical protein VEH76_08790 [Methylocystis sp.]|nr:hypothetical protein [Methylocystis sp.]